MRKRGEKIITIGILLSVIFACFIDSEGKAYEIIFYGEIISELITLIGIFINDLDQKRAESISRTKQIREKSKIIYYEAINSINAEKNTGEGVNT